MDWLSCDWAYANVGRLLLRFLADDLAGNRAAMDFLLILVLFFVLFLALDADDLAGDRAAMDFLLILILIFVVVEIGKNFASDRAAFNSVVMGSLLGIVRSPRHIHVVLAEVVLGIVIILVLVIAVVVSQAAMAENSYC